MKNMSDYLDRDGYVGHFWENGEQKLEFGDGALRLGQYHIGLFLDLSTVDIVHSFQFAELAVRIVKGKEPVRHPDNKFWWGQAGTMSRDNLYGLIDGAVIMKVPGVNRAIRNKLKKRWGFTWNTKAIWSYEKKKIPICDWCGPLTWRRMSPYWPDWKLILCDLLLVPTVFLRVLTLKINPDHTSPEPIFVMGILNRRVSPTTISTWVEKFYLKNQKWKEALLGYFKDPKAPPLGELLIKAVENGD